MSVRMNIRWSSCEVVESSSEVLGGAPVVRGTRIPVSAIFENLEGGATIAELVEWFPGLQEKDVKEILRFAAQSAAA